ncbi:MAG: cell division protein FtsK, partial [Pseudonocardiaceae bacterium]
WYLVLAAAHAPRGAGVVSMRVLRYLTDAEARPLATSAVRRDALEDYLKVTRVRSTRVRARHLGAAVTLLILGGVLAWLGRPPGWLVILSAVLGVLVLGRVGRPADRPIVGRSVVLPQAPRLTDEIVLQGLGACGVPPKQVSFSAPIQRDGPGWRAEVELPHSVVASEVIAKREKLAGGLRRQLGCVWPEPLPDGHPGQLVIWVGDKDLAKAPQPPWPLLTQGRVDLFGPVPYATDQRGRWIMMTFMFTSGVIGSIPRVGKTYALREMLLIAALDPRARIYAFDLKGTGDFSPLESVAYAYAKGDEPDAIEYGRDAMSDLRQEMRRRVKVIASLPRDLCPEFKVTSDLADKRSLGLEPVFVGIDESQVWFGHAEYGGDFEADITDLVKRGPAVGIM